MIEDQGGEHIDRLCVGRDYEFTGPAGKNLVLPGCGNATIFKIPFESPNAAVLDTIELCAVCDGLGFKPRFFVMGV